VKSFHVHWNNTRIVTNHRGIVVVRRFPLADGSFVLVYTADLERLDASSPFSGFRTRGWSVIRNAEDAAANTSIVLFKTVTEPLLPLMEVDHLDESVDTGVDPARSDELSTLVKFSLTRHNEHIQRAIDSSILVTNT